VGGLAPRGPRFRCWVPLAVTREGPPRFRRLPRSLSVRIRCWLEHDGPITVRAGRRPARSTRPFGAALLGKQRCWGHPVRPWRPALRTPSSNRLELAPVSTGAAPGGARQPEALARVADLRTRLLRAPPPRKRRPSLGLEALNPKTYPDSTHVSGPVQSKAGVRSGPAPAAPCARPIPWLRCPGRSTDVASLPDVTGVGPADPRRKLEPSRGHEQLHRAFGIRSKGS